MKCKLNVRKCSMYCMIVRRTSPYKVVRKCSVYCLTVRIDPLLLLSKLSSRFEKANWVPRIDLRTFLNGWVIRVSNDAVELARHLDSFFRDLIWNSDYDFHRRTAVWPDLEKFHQNFKTLGNLWRVYLVFGKIVSPIWQTIRQSSKLSLL